MNVFYFGWYWEGSNSFYIPFARPNPLRGNEVAEKFIRIPSKLTFVDSYFEVWLSEGL